MATGGFYWSADRRAMPSQYYIPIGGVELACFVAKKSEVGSADLYAWINRETGLDVAAVGVAAGPRGKQARPTYPANVKEINGPMYHKGGLRRDGVESLWAECKAACSQKKAIIVHWNQ